MIVIIFNFFFLLFNFNLFFFWPSCCIWSSPTRDQIHASLATTPTTDATRYPYPTLLGWGSNPHPGAAEMLPMLMCTTAGTPELAFYQYPSFNPGFAWEFNETVLLPTLVTHNTLNIWKGSCLWGLEEPIAIDPEAPGNLHTEIVPPLLVHAASWGLGKRQVQVSRGVPTL